MSEPNSQSSDEMFILGASARELKVESAALHAADQLTYLARVKALYDGLIHQYRATAERLEPRLTFNVIFATMELTLKEGSPISDFDIEQVEKAYNTDVLLLIESLDMYERTTLRKQNYPIAVGPYKLLRNAQTLLPSQMPQPAVSQEELQRIWANTDMTNPQYQAPDPRGEPQLDFSGVDWSLLSSIDTPEDSQAPVQTTVERVMEHAQLMSDVHGGALPPGQLDQVFEVLHNDQTAEIAEAVIAGTNNQSVVDAYLDWKRRTAKKAVEEASHPSALEKPVAEGLAKLLGIPPSSIQALRERLPDLPPVSVATVTPVDTTMDITAGLDDEPEPTTQPERYFLNVPAEEPAPVKRKYTAAEQGRVLDNVLALAADLVTGQLGITGDKVFQLGAMIESLGEGEDTITQEQMGIFFWVFNAIPVADKVQGSRRRFIGRWIASKVWALSAGAVDVKAAATDALSDFEIWTPPADDSPTV